MAVKKPEKAKNAHICTGIWAFFGDATLSRD
jgi:hypothetical protein